MLFSSSFLKSGLASKVNTSGLKVKKGKSNRTYVKELGLKKASKPKGLDKEAKAPKKANYFGKDKA